MYPQLLLISNGPVLPPVLGQRPTSGVSVVESGLRTSMVSRRAFIDSRRGLCDPSSTVPYSSINSMTIERYYCNMVPLRDKITTTSPT